MKPSAVISCCLLGCILWMSGCASTPTKVSSGPITAGSFCFVKPKAKPYPVFADPDQKVHDAVQKAITDSMAARDIRKTDSGGDVVVAYMIITGNNASIATIEDYFGYGRDASKLRDTAYEKYTEGSGQSFNAGTLLIDIIDGSGRVLYRGHTSRALLADPTPEQRASRVREAVDEILSRAQFRK
jgi:hypothetical protein